MSIQIVCAEDGPVIELQTPHVRAVLIPALPLDLLSPLVKRYFDQRLARRRAQGYGTEDAATLALFDCTIAQVNGTLSATPLSATLRSADPDAKDLLQFQLFPQLKDQSESDAPRKPTHHAQAPAHTAAPALAFAFARMVNPNPGIYPIVDSTAQLEPLMAAGAQIIQLRIKAAALTPQIEQEIAQAVAIAARYPRAQLFINDYWQAAITCGAYGVHLGQEDLQTADLTAIAAAGLRLGVSSHAFWEVARAAALSPSYIACGPVFPTRAKVMPWIPQGVGNLRYWAALLPFPVIGIGGINADNLDAVAATGCTSASVIAAIVTSPIPANTYRSLQTQWTTQCNQQRQQHGNHLSPTHLGQQTIEPVAPLARPTLA